MFKRWRLSLFMVACLQFHAAAAERPVLRVAVEPNWPPMEYLDRNGETVGFTVDYIHAVAREMGFDVQYISMGWEDIFDGLAGGKYDVIASSVSITEERKRRMAFSSPYYEVQQVVVTPFDTVVRSERDFDGKRLGAQTGTTGASTARAFRDATVEVFPDIADAFAALADKRLDGVVCDDPVGANYILENLDDKMRMKVALFVQSDEPEYFGFAVAGDNVRLLDILNKGIARVQERGVEEKLRRKWIGY